MAQSAVVVQPAPDAGVPTSRNPAANRDSIPGSDSPVQELDKGRLNRPGIAARLVAFSERAAVLSI